MLKADYEEQLKFVEFFATRLSDLTPTNAANIANSIFPYGNKDKWLVKASKSIKNAKSEELTKLLHAAYEDQLEIANSFIPLERHVYRLSARPR